MNDFPLHTHPAAVNDAHLPKLFQMSLKQVLLNDVGHIARAEGMQVDPVFNWNFNRFCYFSLLPIYLDAIGRWRTYPPAHT
jgi:hypothetical protein